MVIFAPEELGLRCSRYYHSKLFLGSRNYHLRQAFLETCYFVKSHYFRSQDHHFRQSYNYLESTTLDLSSEIDHDFKA